MFNIIANIYLTI